MKVFFVLFLFTFISCEKSIIDIGMCLYKNPTVKEIVNEALIALTTKDFSKLLPKIVNSLPEIIKAAITCISEEDEVNLKGPSYKCTRHELFLCGQQCKSLYEIGSDKYQECQDLCIKNCGY